MEFKLPKNVKVEKDELRLRLDFYRESVVLTEVLNNGQSVRVVSALDVAQALAREMAFNSGILPDNTLWWSNQSGGPVTAIWDGPKTRVLALQSDPGKPPKRFRVPLPGLIFLCRPTKPPAVFAVKRKPVSGRDIVYHAPLANLFSNGMSCPGSHRYPARLNDMVESFFASFFSATADLRGRSVKYTHNVLDAWKWLDGKKDYPLGDLVEFGTVKDLMEMRL